MVDGGGLVDGGLVAFAAPTLVGAFDVDEGLLDDIDIDRGGDI